MAKIRYRERLTPNRKPFERATFGEVQIVVGRRIVHRAETTQDARDWASRNGVDLQG